MSTFTKLAYHIVFSTKYRQPLIKGDVKTRLYEYIGGIIRKQENCLIEIGGVEDHIHLLINLSPKTAVSDSIREIKTNSSKWCNTLTNNQNRFEWQKGYGAFTVSYSHIESVQNYIKNQEEYHKTKSFKEEYIRLLQLHNINFEEKYLFENEYFG